MSEHSGLLVMLKVEKEVLCEVKRGVLDPIDDIIKMMKHRIENTINLRSFPRKFFCK